MTTMDSFSSKYLEMLTFCVTLSVFISSALADSSDKTEQPQPCCFPYKFQADVVPVESFTANSPGIVRVIRDWESRLQIQQTIAITPDGNEIIQTQVFSDFKNMIQYISAGGSCKTSQIQFGMLEPCMPDDAKYLGISYIGQYDNKADINGWYFRRTDQNRDIEMTVAVTADRCVPVMEHITGTMAGKPSKVLVLFTNLREDVPDELFNFPPECFPLAPM